MMKHTMEHDEIYDETSQEIRSSYSLEVQIGHFFLAFRTSGGHRSGFS